MMLTCPSCGARFRVKPEMFASGARTVRCSRCGHQWRGQPDPETAEAAAPAAETPRQPEPETEAPAAAPEPEAEPDEPAGSESAADEEEGAEGEPDAAGGEYEAEEDDAAIDAETDDVADSRREPVFDTIPGAVRQADVRHARPADGRARRTPAWVWGGWALILAVVVLTALALAFMKKPITNAWPPSQRLYDLIDSASGEAEAAPPIHLAIESSKIVSDEGAAHMELDIKLTNNTAQTRKLPIAVIHLLDAEGELIRTERIRLNDEPLAPKETRSMRLVLQDVPDGLEKVRADTESAD